AGTTHTADRGALRERHARRNETKVAKRISGQSLARHLLAATNFRNNGVETGLSGDRLPCRMASLPVVLLEPSFARKRICLVNRLYNISDFAARGVFLLRNSFWARRLERLPIGRRKTGLGQAG